MKSSDWLEASPRSHTLALRALVLGAFLLWCFPTLISSTRALTRASSTFVCFLGPLLTQLHADLCADPPGCLNPVAGTVVYRKLLGEASAELSKASKLTAVTIPFYLMSVRCQPTSSTTFLQSPLQLSIVLASLPVQPVAKLGFDPLVLPTCRSQFRGPVTIMSSLFKASYYDQKFLIMNQIINLSFRELFQIVCN